MEALFRIRRENSITIVTSPVTLAECLVHPLRLGLTGQASGYMHGHKVNRFEERQIGLVKMPRDRYAGRVATGSVGEMTTPLLTFAGGRMTVNANAAGGSVRIQLTGAEGKPIPGFTYDDCPALTGDGLDLPVQWPKPLDALAGTPVQITFALQDATIYGFTIAAPQ